MGKRPPRIGDQILALTPSQTLPVPDYIKNSNYQSWKMWPGKEAFYPTMTHSAAFMTTYMNDVALATIQGHTGIMKEDSVLVNENYGAEKKLMALTVMYKVDGYDPAHNDWFWAKYAPDGTIRLSIYKSH